MHIVFLSTFGGGLDTYCHTLGRALSERNHHVRIVYPDCQAYSTEQKNVRMHVVRLPGLPNYLEALFYYAGRICGRIRGTAYHLRRLGEYFHVKRFLDKIHKEMRIDVLEVHEGFYVPRFLRLNYPIVVRLHGSSYTYAKMCHEIIKPIETTKAKYDGSLLRKCNGITSPTMASAEAVVHLQGTGLVEKIKVIPNPLDMPGEFSADVLAEKENIILFAGRVETRKGAHWLLSALAELDLRRYGYKAFLAGDLSGEEEIRNRVEDERIIRKIGEGTIVLMGSIPRSELITLYKKARIVIVPSVWEVFGYTAIEGMAFGAIVIAHRTGGLTEIVENGVNGLLFNSADELHSLIEKCMSGYAVDSLPLNAMSYVKRHYSTDILIPRFISYYNKVIADHKTQVRYK